MMLIILVPISCARIVGSKIPNIIINALMQIEITKNKQKKNSNPVSPGPFSGFMILTNKHTRIVYKM